jgi:hypothetical protein
MLSILLAHLPGFSYILLMFIMGIGCGASGMWLILEQLKKEKEKNNTE